MENSIRFRNHISIVAERIFRAVAVILVGAAGGLLQNIGEIMEEPDISPQDVRILLMIAGGAILLLILIIAWQVVVWSKTFISVYDNTIVLERNTLNRKKNTIGIQNISNVNMERNVFEMLIGTSKVKLDTDSLSTADSTDVKIVLKREDAERFRKFIMERLGELDGEDVKWENAKCPENPESPEVLEEKAGYTVTSDIGDMMRHGLYSINLFSVLVILGGIGGVVKVVLDVAGEGMLEKSVASIVTGSLVFITVLASAVWDVVKGFIKYYDFEVTRREERLYIRYGLFRKVSYTIPVDKINALKLTQSAAARLTGTYMAEILNVGMGDDQEERQSFLMLYDKKEKIKKQLELLLPEYTGILEKQVELQPSCVWAVWSLPACVFLALMGAAALLLSRYLGEYLIWILAGVLVCSLWAGIMLICRRRTAGVHIGEGELILAGGYLKKKLLSIHYQKIQHVQIEQNFLGKRLKIQKGTAYLLASAGNRAQEIPYFKEVYLQKLKEGICGGRKKQDVRPKE